MLLRHDQNNFDGVRLAAALAVLASHQCLLSGLAEPRPIGPMTLGSIAVLVFFAISGYLVASSWTADPTPWRFAARRFLRIWPAYAVVVLAASAWIMATDDRPLATTAAWMFIVKHLTFHSFEWVFFPQQHDPRLDPPLWTIPFEIGCYAAFAFVAVVTQAAWGWRLTAFDPSDASLATDAVLFGAFFSAGALLQGFPALRDLRSTAVLVAAGVAAFLAGSQVLGLTLAIPALAVAVGMRAWPGLAHAGRFGDFSYGVYLWGWPIQQIVATRLGRRAGFWPLAGLAFLAVAVVAALSWHLVEKRALRAKPSSRTPWPRWLTLERG